MEAHQVASEVLLVEDSLEVVLVVALVEAALEVVALLEVGNKIFLMKL
jgi:hypothetical protein